MVAERTHEEERRGEAIREVNENADDDGVQAAAAAGDGGEFLKRDL